MQFRRINDGLIITAILSIILISVIPAIAGQTSLIYNDSTRTILKESGAGQYSILALSGQNGGISPSGTVAVSSGAGRTFVMTPFSGYQVSNVFVDGISIGAVSSYTFWNVTAEHVISVSFSVKPPQLTVAKSGGGTGTITSAPLGISCGGTCTASYDPGTSVTLTAAPDTDSQFAGWSGGCTGTAKTCNFALNADTTVTATFNMLPPVADFSGSPLSGQAPLLVNFTDASTNSPTAWEWTFDDTETAAVQNPSHTFRSAGTFTVSVTASNSGGSNTATKSGYITVTACSNPTIMISGSGYVPTSIQDAYNNVGDGGTIQVQAFDFTEDLNFSRPLSVTLSGGFNCPYSANPSDAVLHGSLTISAGTVVIGNITIE